MALTDEKKREVLKELSDALDASRFSASRAVCASYRGTNFNILLPWQAGPDFVVMPREVGEVQATLRIANRHGLTVMPIGCGTITAFWGPDIVMDMMGMKKIHKIDTRNSYVVVEPGVTFSELLPLLRNEGYTISMGSFLPAFSVLTNLGAIRNFNHTLSGRLADQTLGIELVLPDGTLVRTSTATYGIDYWSRLTVDMPDVKGLFTPTTQTHPPFGIITKGALRIWPILEARALPVTAFDSLEKGMEYSIRVSQAGMSDMTMCWNWTLVGIINSRLSSPKVEFDFLNYLIDAGTDYSKPYEGLDYVYNWTQIRGYREQVRGSVETCRRIAREVGGRVVEEEELCEKIPKMWSYWKAAYVDFEFEKARMDQWDFPSGVGDTWYYIGKVDDLVALEKGFNRRLKERHDLRTMPYYTRVFEYGTGGHLRYIITTDIADGQEVARLLKVKTEMASWALGQYRDIHSPLSDRRLGTHSVGMGKLVGKIREALDPNKVLYWPDEMSLQPEVMDAATLETTAGRSPS